jgi:hypothetical protein
MSVALDVAIGLAFLYLSLALVVTTLQELIASIWRLRAGHLYNAVAGMLDDDKIEKLFKHPLMRNLANEDIRLNGKSLDWRKTGVPSYIPSKTFALALIDVLRGEKHLTQTLGASEILADAATIVGDLPEGSALKKKLTLLVADAERLSNNVDERARLVSERIEGWFNDRMARASGWYKQRAQLWSFGIAGFVALVANADSIHVVDRLWHDASLRAVVVANAQGFIDSHPKPAARAEAAGATEPTTEVADKGRQAAQQLKELAGTGLPVGWQWTKPFVPCPRLHDDSTEAKPKCWDPGLGDGLLLLLGWALTTMAVSLGANFWFDTLSRALQLRGSGPRVSEASGKVEK